MSKSFLNRNFVIFICLAWFCESIMDTIDHHQHSSWLFKINWPDAIMIWLKSDWTNRSSYLFGTYDGWHTFKGLMLLFEAAAIWSVTNWQHALIFLSLFFFIHEIVYGNIMIW